MARNKNQMNTVYDIQVFQSMEINIKMNEFIEQSLKKITTYISQIK